MAKPSGSKKPECRANGVGAVGAQALGASIFDYIDRLQGLRGADAVIGAMTDQLRVFGVEYFTMFRPSRSAGELRDGILAEKQHVAWTRQFYARGFAENNPALTGALDENGPLFWSELVRLPDHGERMQPMLALARDFGLNEGICFSLRGCASHPAGAALFGSHIDASAEARIAIHAVTLFTYNRLARLGVMGGPDAVRLSTREVDCLAWVAKGKTDWEIGEILGIRASTVHSYIEGAKRKLGVVTRMQAVVGAIQHGCIVP